MFVALPKRGYLVSQSLSSTICEMGLMLTCTVRMAGEGACPAQGKSSVRQRWAVAEHKAKDLQAENRLTRLWTDVD